MSTEAQTNSSSIKRYIDSEQKISNQQSNERNFLRQFNTNFDSYKKYINSKLYEKDTEETQRLNDISQPIYIYNNFPIILGIIFLVFGLFLIYSENDNDNNLFYKADMIK